MARKRKTRKTRKRNHKVNAVKLTSNGNRVLFSTIRGTGRATMANSAGDFTVMSSDEASERIATLVAKGWKVAKAV
jgi:hypothetical protein